MALANATVDSKEILNTTGSWGFTQQFDLSGLTAGATVNLPHDGPTATAVDFVEFALTTRPTDGSLVSLSSYSTDTTNSELDLRFDTQAGGALDGAVVRVLAHWRAAGRQDGQSINQDTDVASTL